MITIRNYDKSMSWLVRTVFKLGVSVKEIPERETMIREMTVLRLIHEKEYELMMWVDWLTQCWPVTVKKIDREPWFFIGKYSLMPIETIRDKKRRIRTEKKLARIKRNRKRNRTFPGFYGNLTNVR